MRLLILLLWLLPGIAWSTQGLLPGSKKPDFLPVEQAFVLSVETDDKHATTLHWQISKGYYLYKNRLQFEGLEGNRKPLLPPGEPHHDEYFGKQEVYRQALTVTVPEGEAKRLKVTWQGCAESGLCYPPQSRFIDLVPSAPLALQASDQTLASGLQQQTLLWSLVVFFGLGVLLAFTPCSLPMLPILAGIVVGSGASPRRGLALAGVYVLAMALVYAVLGAVAASLGANLQATLQNPWLLGTFAALFIVLALPMFGVFELQLPSFMRDRLENAGRKQQGGSLFGAGMLGILSGLLVGPCMTAPLAAALLFIAQSGNLLHGGLVLFALGLGIGAPLLLLVTMGNRFLPKPGAWMDRVKLLFGFLFLAASLLIVRTLLPDSLWLGLWGCWLIALATLFRHVSLQWETRQGIGQAVSLMMGIWGMFMLLGAAGGASDPLKPLAVYAPSATPIATEDNIGKEIIDLPALDAELAKAKESRQWVLIDFYADWCISCKVMDDKVFRNPSVQAGLADVRIVRPDVTHSDAASRALLERYQVLGPPTLLWIGPDGQERRNGRITGEVDAEEFLQRWNALKEHG
ncbi:protein-disulfide reductase DsbD [Pseudomonas sp. JZ134]|uniref:protein-disulfide reductase DsbD n=1 Tax=Pseudomonas sp. JZ134 TaxID=2806615 RepID=UPI003DA1A98B